jgi:hypothetical protein
MDAPTATAKLATLKQGRFEQKLAQAVDLDLGDF